MTDTGPRAADRGVYEVSLSVLPTGPQSVRSCPAGPPGSVRGSHRPLVRGRAGEQRRHPAHAMEANPS